MPLTPQDFALLQDAETARDIHKPKLQYRLQMEKSSVEVIASESELNAICLDQFLENRITKLLFTHRLDFVQGMLKNGDGWDDPQVRMHSMPSCSTTSSVTE